jgi:hypothetical protein
MRIVIALGLLTLSLSSMSAPQSLPVLVRPPLPPANRETGRAAERFGASLRKRFEALGVKVIYSVDSLSVVEVNFSVLPLKDGTYDIAEVLTVLNCGGVGGRTAPCSRSAPLDWAQVHANADLEKAARDLADMVRGELAAFANFIRNDSIARAAKH